MNEIIYKISLVVLSIGFILMIIYITMIITKKSTTCSNNISNNTTNKDLTSNNLNLIYDDRPSITYRKMFKNPEVGFGYQDFDVNDNSETTSFYFKSNI